MGYISDSRIKIFVVSIVLLFIIQEILIYNYISEPYPALRMPPFSGTNLNAEGFYETSSVDIEIFFEDEDQLLVTPNRFFYDSPISHRWVLSGTFKPAPETLNTVPHKEFAALKPVFPGFFISRQRSDFEVQRHPETVQWLKNKINDIAPDKNPQLISFKWYRDQYHPDRLLQRERELSGITNIEL